MSTHPIKKILCPVDFSNHSEHALRFALGLAKQLDAMMDALHVFHVPFYAPPHQPLEALQALSEQYRDQGRKDEVAVFPVAGSRFLPWPLHCSPHLVTSPEERGKHTSQCEGETQ